MGNLETGIICVLGKRGVSQWEKWGDYIGMSGNTATTANERNGKRRQRRIKGQNARETKPGASFWTSEHRTSAQLLLQLLQHLSSSYEFKNRHEL